MNTANRKRRNDLDAMIITTKFSKRSEGRSARSRDGQKRGTVEHGQLILLSVKARSPFLGLKHLISAIHAPSQGR